MIGKLKKKQLVRPKWTETETGFVREHPPVCQITLEVEYSGDAKEAIQALDDLLGDEFVQVSIESEQKTIPFSKENRIASV